MARTKRRRRGYSAGERGRNRVRVFPDPKTGLIQIEWREDGHRRSRSLGHRDWDRAKSQADEVAAGRAGGHVQEPVEAEPAPLTLKTLFSVKVSSFSSAGWPAPDGHEMLTSTVMK